MSLKSIWKKFVKAFEFAPSVNAMDAYDVAYIDQKVRAETPFSVGCMDTRLVNGRRNVGLVLPETTPAEEVARAEDIFIAAAKEKGIEITRDKILRYVPGTITKPGRAVQPTPRTWK